ncbi:MAG: ABC transporter ATP-binding protein [Dehalococcoidia bacterium]
MPKERSNSLQTLWFFLKPYKRYLAILLVLSLLNGFLETLQMAMLFPILNASLEQGAASYGAFFSILNSLSEVMPIDDPLLSNCTLFVIFTVLYCSCRLIYANLSPRFTARIVRDHEQEVFRKYTEADYRFFADVRQGDLLYKGSQAPQFIGYAVIALTRSAVEIVLGIFVLYLLISLSWKAAIAVVIAGAGYYYFAQYLGKRISYVTGKKMLQEIENENVIINEYINGAKQIRASGNSDKWTERFNQAAFSRWKHWWINQFWSQVPTHLLELLMFGAVGIILIIIRLYSPYQFYSLIPLFGTFAYAVFKLLPKLTNTGRNLMDVVHWIPNLETVREFLLDEHYTQMENGSTEFHDIQHGIELKYVSFTHTSREHTLDDISLSIEKDRVTAVVGHSGSGKSTIADLLLRLYDVDKGQILVDGRDIREYDIFTFLGKVGFVGQETFIFNASIRDNIAFGNEHLDEEVVEAAKLANVHEFITELPEGYDTVVGDRGIKLSGGQRQRIAIARAMIRKPRFLILDEATSSLDNISEAVVQKALDRVAERCTTLVIAHRLTTIKDADIIYVLDNGRIVENGTHTQLLERQGTYSKIYREG